MTPLLTLGFCRRTGEVLLIPWLGLGLGLGLANPNPNPNPSQAAQPPLLPRLAGMLGPSADKPTTLMVLRCFANALHCAQLRPLAAEVRARARLGLGLGLGL